MPEWLQTEEFGEKIIAYRDGTDRLKEEKDAVIKKTVENYSLNEELSMLCKEKCNSEREVKVYERDDRLRCMIFAYNKPGKSEEEDQNQEKYSSHAIYDVIVSPNKKELVLLEPYINDTTGKANYMEINHIYKINWGHQYIDVGLYFFRDEGTKKTHYTKKCHGPGDWQKTIFMVLIDNIFSKVRAEGSN